jgi:hypothetical protein
VEVVHDSVLKRSVKQIRDGYEYRDGVFREFVFRDQVKHQSRQCSGNNLEVQEKNRAFEDQIEGKQKKENGIEMNGKVAAPIAMKGLGHQLALEREGHHVIKDGEVIGIRLERVMLECPQDNEEQRPSQEENEKKSILAIEGFHVGNNSNLSSILARSMFWF